MDLCTCTNPFCGEDHAHCAPTSDGVRPVDLDEWEGPEGPEYSEYDAESFDEMVRDDMMGRS